MDFKFLPSSLTILQSHKGIPPRASHYPSHLPITQAPTGYSTGPLPYTYPISHGPSSFMSLKTKEQPWGFSAINLVPLLLQ